MHQTVFFGFGTLVTLGATLLLGRLRGVSLSNLMTSLTLILGGAALGGTLLGFALHGSFSVGSMGAVFGGGIVAVAIVPFFFPENRRSAYDVLISACVLGLLATRVGCHVHGCDLGAPTDAFWGILPNSVYGQLGDQPVHPFPWLIIVPTVFMFLVAWVRKTEPGSPAIHVAAGYLIVRFLAEFFRAPSALQFGGLHLNQGLAIVALVAVVIFGCRLRKI